MPGDRAAFSPQPPGQRDLPRRIALAILGLTVALLGAEAWVRIAKPKPARQIVRGDGVHTADGVPVWEHASDRYNRDCVGHHPERIRILFFGSSITFGTDLSAPETFAAELESRLNELYPAPGFCVLNFAQPGFVFAQNSRSPARRSRAITPRSSCGRTGWTGSTIA